MSHESTDNPAAPGGATTDQTAVAADKPGVETPDAAPDPRAIREALNLTQAEVAERVGLSQSQVSRLETNPARMRLWQRREYERLLEEAAKAAAEKAEPASEAAQ